LWAWCCKWDDLFCRFDEEKCVWVSEDGGSVEFGRLFCQYGAQLMVFSEFPSAFLIRCEINHDRKWYREA
jgi:hypothetical protein